MWPGWSVCSPARVGQLVQRADVSDAARITENDHFRVARDGETGFAAGGRSTARAGLREDDFADAAGTDFAGDAADDSVHAGVFGGERAARLAMNHARTEKGRERAGDRKMPASSGKDAGRSG